MPVNLHKHYYKDKLVTGHSKTFSIHISGKSPGLIARKAAYNLLGKPPRYSGTMYTLGKPPRLLKFYVGKATQMSTCMYWESHPVY